MSIVYDATDLPGAPQVLNGSRALLQYCHATRLTMPVALVLIRLAQVGQRCATEHQLVEDLGMRDVEVSQALASLHRHGLASMPTKLLHRITEEGQVHVSAMIQAVLLTNE